MTGAIPTELGRLADLESLYLRYNYLTGPIPESFLELEALERFRFERADLSLRALPEVSYSRLSTPRSDSLPLLDPVNGEVRGILRDLPQANAAAALAPQAGPGSLDMLFSRGIPDVGAWGR